MFSLKVHVIHGKHTCSVSVSIDSRCKIVNYEGNPYPELRHTKWWRGFFVKDIIILCDDLVVKLRKNNSFVSQSTSTTPAKTASTTRQDRNYELKTVVYKDCITFENEEVLTKDQIKEIKNMSVLHSNQKVTKLEFELYILKLLHSYILPSFVFGSGDLEWLNWLLRTLTEELQNLDEEFIKDDKHLVKFATKLREKRLAFRNLPESKKKNLLKTCNYDFLKTMISHLQIDCQLLEENYNKSRKRVQILKDGLKTCKPVSEDLKDEEIKQKEEEEEKIERDLFFEREESHRIWEEMVGLKMNIADMEFVKTKAKEEAYNKKSVKGSLSLVENYLEIDELREKLKKKITEICSDKIRLKAVIGEIKVTIQEVEIFGESIKMEDDYQEEIFSSFNISKELVVDSWQNCHKKVKSLIRNSNEVFNKYHEDFKCKMQLKISFLVSEQYFFQGRYNLKMRHKTKEADKDKGDEDDGGGVNDDDDDNDDRDNDDDDDENNNNNNVDCDNDNNDDDDDNNNDDCDDDDDDVPLSNPTKEHNIFDPFPDIWVGIIKQIKDQIHEHILNMCKLISSSEFRFEKSEQNEIPRIYESILFSDLMNDLSKLFETALKSFCKGMSSKIKTLSYKDLLSNILFLNHEANDAQGENNASVSGSVPPRPKKDSRISLQKSMSLLNFGKEFPRNSSSFLAENQSTSLQRENYREALYIPSTADSKSSLFPRKTVSSLYKDADLEYKVLCKEKTQTVRDDALHFDDTKGKQQKTEKISPFFFKNRKEFVDFFHSSFLSIEKLFSSTTLQSKIDFIVRTLKCISYSVMKLNHQLVTADDLIGILSLIFSSLNEEQLKKLCQEVVFINTFISQQEQIGLKGNALVHFVCALENLYQQALDKAQN